MSDVIKSGRYVPLSVTEAVANAKEMLNLENTTEWDNFLEKKIDEAIRHLRSNQTTCKLVGCFDIIDGKIELPAGFQRLLGLRFTDENGTCYGQTYIDSAFIKECGCNDVVAGFDYHNSFEITGGYIRFHDIANLNVDTAKLAYLSRNVNEDGLMVMYDHQERGVTAYACWRFLQKMPAHFETMTKTMMNEYKREWGSQKQWVRGVEAQDNFMENRKQIGAIFNAYMYDKHLD